MNVRVVIMAVTAALLLASCGPSSATALVAQGLERQPDGWYGVPVTRERPLPDVTLTATDGTPIQLAQAFRGTPTLVFFGYSYCPDICPVHLAALTSSMQTARVGFDQVDVVFVSVDLDRDTPERIDEFLGYFNSRIHGLYTEDEQLLRDTLAALDLGGPIIEGPDPRGEGNLIGHPAQVIGFDSDGLARRVWPFGARRSDWVADLPRIVESW